MDLYETSLESFNQSVSIIEIPAVQTEKSDSSLSSHNNIDYSLPLDNSKPEKNIDFDSYNFSFECISNKSLSNPGKLDKKNGLDNQIQFNKLTYDLRQLLQFAPYNPPLKAQTQFDLLSCEDGMKKRKINGGQEMKQLINRLNGNKKLISRRTNHQGSGLDSRRKAWLQSMKNYSNTQQIEEKVGDNDFLLFPMTFDSQIDEAVKKELLKNGSKKQGNYGTQEKYKSGIFMDPDSNEAYKNWALGSESKNSALSQANYNQGLALYKQGKCQNAIKRFKQALYYNPSFSEAYYQWAIALDTLGKYSESTQVYKKTVAINPQCAEAYYRLGLALYRLEKYQEAMASLEAVETIFSANDQLSFTNEDKSSQGINEKESPIEKESSKGNSKTEEEYSIIDKQDSFEILRRVNVRFSNINLNKETLSDSQSEFELLLEAINKMNIESRVQTEHVDDYSNHETVCGIMKGFNVDPVQNMAYSLHGIILAKQGKFKEALEKFEKTTSLDPVSVMFVSIGDLLIVNKGNMKRQRKCIEEQLL